MNTIKIMFQFPVALVTSYHKLSDLKRQKFLGLPAVKSPPADAGSPGSTPGLGLCATTIEPVLSSPGASTPEACTLEPVLHNKGNHRSEKSAWHN